MKQSRRRLLLTVCALTVFTTSALGQGFSTSVSAPYRVVPNITIQGDADPTVPYSHSVRLQDALKKAAVDGQLVTIPGGKHGGFTRAENQGAYTSIKAFLAKHGLGPATTSN